MPFVGIPQATAFLLLLRVAHACARLWWAAQRLLAGMLLRLPARLRNHFNVVLSSNSSRSMVVTRRQRGQQEGMQQVLQRLQQHCQEQQQHAPVSTRLAAVLVPLFAGEDGVVRVWLTQRSAHLNSHQGEVCLPGGKRDASDPDDAFTATREAHEEMGLPPESVQVICHLPPMLSKHLLSVTPVVAQVPASFVPAPNPAEVQAVFSMPLSCFLDSQRHLHWDVRSSRSTTNRVYRVHSFDWQGQVVWGLTAAIMIEVAKLALGRQPDFEVDHPSNSSSSGGAGGGSSSSRGGGHTAQLQDAVGRDGDAAGAPPQPRM